MKTKISIALCFGLAIIATSNMQCQDSLPPHLLQGKLAIAPQGQLQTGKICFINNRYMGNMLIPVEVEGNTYYGCCAECVEKLTTDRTARYSTDPLTGKEVDKATAFIVIKPGGSKAESLFFESVMYFESEKNYEKYFKKI